MKTIPLSYKKRIILDEIALKSYKDALLWSQILDHGTLKDLETVDIETHNKAIYLLKKFFNKKPL